jgi:hypothetical protein
VHEKLSKERTGTSSGHDRFSVYQAHRSRSVTHGIERAKCSLPTNRLLLSLACQAALRCIIMAMASSANLSPLPLSRYPRASYVVILPATIVLALFVSMTAGQTLIINTMSWICGSTAAYPRVNIFERAYLTHLKWLNSSIYIGGLVTSFSPTLFSY